MKTKVLRTAMTIMTACALTMPTAITVFAEDIPTGTVNSVEQTASGSTSSGTSSSSGSGFTYSSTGSAGATSSTMSNMPSSSELQYIGSDMIQEGVTTDEIGTRVVSKAYRIADWFRSAAVPIFIVTFVISVLVAVFGALSKKATIMPGVIGIGCSLLAFVLTYNAPYIFIWASNFFTS